MAEVAELSQEKLLQPKKENVSDVPKSSSEILTELFGVFNAKPPEITEDVVSNDEAKKRKKGKKKSKHKKKKKKKSQKRGRSSSDASDNESESEVKKKVKKSKHKKKKHKRSKSSDGSRSSPSNLKRSNSAESEEDSNSEISKKRQKIVSINVDESKIKLENEDRGEVIDEEKKTDISEMNEIPIPSTPDVSRIQLPEEKKTQEKSNVDADKNKNTSNKIQIKNLKFSSVFEANVKQAEEEARKRAEKFEEGQLTETSSSTSETKVLSDVESGNESHKETDLRNKLNKMLSKREEKAVDQRSEKHHSSKRKSRSKSKTRKSHHRSKSKSRRSHSKSPNRSRSRSRHRSRGRRSSSYNRSRSRHHSERSRRREHRRSREKENRIEIDKKRLLEIARKNAITMLQTGSLPTTANLGTQAQKNVITAIKCGGKSVDELTDFCKNLSRQEAIGELSSVSSNSDAEADKNDATTKPFNNPFTIKDRAPIVMNIKGGTALPTQSFQEKTLEQTKVLRQQFPVSSGTQHRGAENEWRPVSPPPSVSTAAKTSHESTSGVATKTSSASSDKAPLDSHKNGSLSSEQFSTMPGMIQAPNIPAVLPGPQVFPSTASTPTMDIGSIVSQRLTAIRRLQQNPNDTAAINQMYQVNQEMSKWAQSKQEPGQFTGSTGAQILTPKELASGYQAWARRDQLQTAAPVSSGMGMHLLQKMGWKPGEGLGKQKNGALTPLLLEVKLDTRGLVAKEETKQKPNSKRPYVPTVKTLAGKHPVSLLGEYCSKRKMGVPSYTLCFECGPDHRKNFLFKVTVNGTEYQPSIASANKKQAKADAATVCLQKLGLIQ